MLLLLDVWFDGGRNREPSQRSAAQRAGGAGLEPDIDTGDVDGVAAHREQAEADDAVEWPSARPSWPSPSPRCPARRTRTRAARRSHAEGRRGVAFLSFFSIDIVGKEATGRIQNQDRASLPHRRCWLLHSHPRDESDAHHFQLTWIV
jgi:hypothetical protein